MSGPKADEISFSERLARFERDRARFAEIAVECSQMQRQASGLSEQTLELGVTGCPDCGACAWEIAGLQRDMDMTNSAESLAKVGQICQRMRQALEVIQKSIAARMQKLEEQYAGAVAGLHAARLDLAALESLASAFSTRAFDHKPIAKRIHSFAAGHPLPERPEFKFTRDSIRRLEQFAGDVAKIRSEIERERDAVTALLDRQVLAELIGDGRERESRQKQLAEVLTHSQPREVVMTKPFDLRLDEKIHLLQVRLERLSTGPARAVLLEQLTAALAEPDEMRKRSLWDSAQLGYSAAMKRKQALDEWLARLDGIEQRVASEADSAEALEVLGRINELRRTQPAGSLADLESQAAMAVTIAAKRRHSRQRLQAVTDSLRELGYAIEMHEATGADGVRWIARQDADADYAVAVNENSELGVLQMQVVRVANDPESASPDQRRRDAERETEFCSDFSQFQERMRRKGYNFRTIHHCPPGQHPVMKIAAGQRRETPAEQSHQAGKAYHRKSEP